MAGRIGLELTQREYNAEPGGPPAEMTIVVRNEGTVVDQFLFRLEGLDPTWYALSIPSISLFPGDQADVQLSLRAPVDGLAGQHPFRIVAASRDDPGESAAVEALLEVGAVGRVQLEISPRRSSARRWASYALQLRNDGNADRSIGLVTSDPADALRFQLEHETMVVPARGTFLTRLHVRPLRAPLIGPRREHTFSVAAQSADDPLSVPLAEISGELLQTPPLAFLAAVPPGARRAALVMLPLVIAAALAIWFLGAPGRGSGLIATPTVPGVASIPTVGASATPPGSVATTLPSTGQPPLIQRFGLNLPAEDPPPHLPLAVDVSGATQTLVERRGEPPGPPRPFRVMEKAEYSLSASNSAGASSRSLTVYVFRPPVIEAFEADPATFQPGQSVRLTWRTDRAERAFLDNRPVELSGAQEVRPDRPSDYVLRAENVVGEAVRHLIVEIGPTATPTSTEQPTATVPPTATWTPTHTATHTPTETPVATDTPNPTDTPSPTDTPRATPQPTDTPRPTETPRPADTPIPTVPPTSTPTSTRTRTPVPTSTPCLKLANVVIAASIADIKTNTVRVTWRSTGGCAPVTAKVTAQYGEQAPYKTYEGLKSSGELTERPPVRCEGTFQITYTLEVRDSSGQSVTQRAQISIFWLC